MEDGELKPPPDSHRVIIRFREHVELPYARGAEESFVRYGRSKDWSALRRRLPEITLVPVFALSDDLLDRVMRRAQLGRERARGLEHGWAEREPPLANLRRFFQVRVSDPDLVTSTLAAWTDIVAAAYFDPPGENPAPPFDPAEVDQGSHLDPAPVGVDVGAVWGEDGLGHGVRVVDIERGADLGHPDLPADVGLIPGATLGLGAPADALHGLQVLGVLIAQENQRDALGIVTQLDELLLSPYTNDDWCNNIETAIVRAVGHLRCGDVILLEVHKNLLPAEAFECVAEAVREATAAGVTVIAAAGNGSCDLDTYPSPYVNATHPAKIDTGSILVGAGHPDDSGQQRTWTRRSQSNFGQRLSCFARGVGVRTTTRNAGAYTHGFISETSGAAAIVAGVAAAVQGIARARFGKPYHPLELRHLLAAGATPSKNAPVDRIGTMPNLAACSAALASPAFDCPATNEQGSAVDRAARNGSQLGSDGSASEGAERVNPEETARGVGPHEETQGMPKIVEFSQDTKKALLSAITNMELPPPPAPPTTPVKFPDAGGKTAHDRHKAWIDALFSTNRAKAEAALTEVGIDGLQRDKVLFALDVVADLAPAIYERLEKEISSLHGPSGHTY